MTTFPIPLLVFFGIVGIGWVMKQILPAGTTLPLSGNVAIGLMIGGVVIFALIGVMILI